MEQAVYLALGGFLGAFLKTLSDPDMKNFDRKAFVGCALGFITGGLSTGVVPEGTSPFVAVLLVASATYGMRAAVADLTERATGRPK